MLRDLLEKLGLKRSNAGPGLVTQALMAKVTSTPEELARRKELRFELMRDSTEQILSHCAASWSNNQLELFSDRLRMAVQLQKSQSAIDDAWSWYVGLIAQAVPDLRHGIYNSINPIATGFGEEGLAEQDRLLNNAEEAFRKAMTLLGRDLKETQLGS